MDKYEKAKELIENGLSISQAAKIVGVNKGSLSRWLKQQQPTKPATESTEPTETETAAEIKAAVSHETFESENDENELIQMINNLQNELALKDTENKSLKEEIKTLKEQIKKLKSQGGCELKGFIQEIGYSCSDIIRLWRIFIYVYWQYYQVARRARRRAKYFIWAGVQLLKELKKHGVDTKELLQKLKYSQHFEEFWLWCFEVDSKFKRDKKAIQALDNLVQSKAKAAQKAANSR